MHKTTIDAWLASSNPALRAVARTLRLAGAARRFVMNPQVRSEQMTRLLNRNQHLQGATYTRADRYPELFAACRDQLAGIPAPRLLSFGCATGEEAFTLARYLPNAEILGVDINRWCLKQCMHNNTNPKLRFVHGTDPAFASATAFDAIFAMAVFQRTEHRLEQITEITGGFTFERFEAEVAALDRRLNVGGMLFLGESDFCFIDTATAARYAPMMFEGNEIVEQRPLFGPDNRFVTSEYRVARGFRKVG